MGSDDLFRQGLHPEMEFGSLHCLANPGSCDLLVLVATGHCRFLSIIPVFNVKFRWKYIYVFSFELIYLYIFF